MPLPHLAGLLVICLSAAAFAQDLSMRSVELTIDPAVSHQTIQGFGAAYIDWGRDRRKEYDDPAFYDTVVNDLGMSIVRQQMQDELEPENDNADPLAFDWNGFKTGNVGSGWSFADRMKFLEEFKKRGVDRFVMSPWTPPSHTKTHRAGRYGGHLRMDKVEEYAEYMAASVILAKKNHGIDIGWVTVQNEPLFIEPYHSCVYNGYTIREAVRALMRRFKQEGITTQILTGEDMMFADRMLNYVKPTMEDAETKDFPGGFCSHRQGGFDEVRKWFEATKHWNRENWMTETSGHQQTWEGALKMASDMHDYLVGGNFSAWIYWQITDSERSGEYAIMVDGKKTPKYHAARHFYRFVRPGAVRIDAVSSDQDVLASAYQDEGKGVAVVLINRSEAPADLTLNLAGPDTPNDWAVTQSTETAGSAEPGRMQDLAAKMTLPPKSITTLVGRFWPPVVTASRPRRIAWTDPSPGTPWGDATANPPEKAPHRTFTPLHTATLSGNLAEIDKLIAEGADINAPAQGNWRPIHMAASTFASGERDGKRFSKYDVFRRILDAKPDVNVATDDGWTPLHAAAANAHTAWQHEPAEVTDRIRDLVTGGCDVNARDAAGRTPLHWAAWQGHSILDQPPDARVVTALLELGADPSVADASGKTALDYAKQMDHTAIAAALGSGATTPAAPTVRTTTPGKFGRELLRAAWDGDEVRVRALLADGADPQWVDSDGFRPIDRARDNGHLAIVELLKEATPTK